MSLFKSTPPMTIGALIDIGSASVLVSYVASRPGDAIPIIVWSHREHVPLRDTTDIQQLAKNLSTAFVNASLLLETTGRQVLKQAIPNHPRPSYVHVTVAAPWSYTVTKTITYRGDESFVISKNLISELVETAEQKILRELKEHEVLAELGLTITAKSTIALTANGYRITGPRGQKASDLALARTNSLVHGYLVTAIGECHEKLLPKTNLHTSSFMLAYYLTTRALYPERTEYCLIDITSEATEIGLVRDGVLQYCTHLSYGAFSLAREISTATKIPLAEAYSQLGNEAYQSNEQTASQIEALYHAYEARVGELLHETGDALSIPKTIILHSNIETENFFSERIKEGAHLATRSAHHVIPVSNDIISRYYTPSSAKDLFTRHDSALLISAQFFHTTHNESDIAWQ